MSADAFLDAWGLSASDVEHLGGDSDDVFEVTAAGQRFALKVTGDAASLERTERILAHLHGHEALAGIAVPQIIATPDGRGVVEVEGRCAQLLSWVSGDPIGAHPAPSFRLVRSWGATAARVAAALTECDVDAPASHGWDFAHAAETARGQSLTALGHRIDPDGIADALRSRPTQIVHHDLHDENVLVSARPNGTGITGVIDFGDVIVAPVVCELAVALASALRLGLPPLGTAGAIAHGWCSVSPLAAADVGLLYPLAVVRLAHALERWTASGRTDRYAIGRTTGLREALDRALSVPLPVATAAVAVTSGHSPPPAALGPVRLPEGARVLRHHLEGGPGVRRRTGLLEPATVHLGVTLAIRSLDLSRREGGGWLRTRPTASGLQVQLWAFEPDPRLPWEVPASERAAWASACVDPFGLPRLDFDAIESLRDRHLAPSQKAYYDDPPVMVSAAGMWFTDHLGRRYLDAVNNVTHLGHGQPDVVAAGAQQMATLNTNSRFLYPQLATYAQRLVDTLPEGLEVVFFCCTGSEANDLALRIARTVTGRDHAVVLGGAYHGNTIAVTGISPNRFDGAGGTGPPSTTVTLDQPDRYRGTHRGSLAEVAPAYIADATARIRRSPAPAALFAESLMGTGGQVVLPPGYLAAVFAATRAAGGLCVSDEVQVGFGRLGRSFWGFETHGVCPDIVTMGKPMGNGHPMSAVVTTREVAEAFDTGMRYFNTFGGNPVSCAIGDAVLEVVVRDDLQHNAAVVGGRLLERLTGLMDRHRIIGDVRGEGLYVGVELVRDRVSREAAPTEARIVAERMMEEGVIVYPNGTSDNVLKVKPPMVATAEHAELIVDALDEVLTAGW